MTSKHYILLAAAIAKIHSPVCRVAAANAIAEALQEDNPRFNRDKFLVAALRNLPKDENNGQKG